MAGDTTFKLRYVGTRFNGARLPVDVLTDLPAFRDLLVAFAKDEWRDLNAGRKRVPKGFDKSISFDLVGIDDGSAVPLLNWSRNAAQENLPGFEDELQDIVGGSYLDVVQLIDGAGHEQFPKSLSSEHIRALNRLGSGLREHEKIEFLGSSGQDGKVVYLDSYRRKALITRVRETYHARFEGVGILRGSFADEVMGRVVLATPEHGEITIPLESDRVKEEFDGNIDSEVQFDLQIEMDNADRLRGVVGVFDLELIDVESGADLLRCRNRLAELRALSDGWHDGVGRRIADDAVELANRFLGKRPTLSKRYHIYPTEEGGILIEFEANSWDISVEFLPGGGMELYGVQIDGADELQPVQFSDIDGDFMAAFDRRVKGG
ncbi:hypothetical protein J4G43_026205 [Bradyrhizobium barranii subsp. barranii]|uniref:Uncharacterized protein n=1 Tax=Bradyrhizobium barranii subsp. barranii TaxID=2823807 RepID=A0A939MBC2_9BRAD|nr:hypothetical protein [Bradyrhizobium barranii]UEM08307.1 hypothetical protein J4G43_026205 [Bradyrhizobium barranii subsp. barranii]